MADKNQTIIIKKIKKGGHAPHGGAWKVAYADFVTAMMAFFLLLWILTATPVESLEGLADYFSPTMGIQGKMGIGFSGGSSPNTEGWSKGDWASLGLIFGAPPSGPIIKMPDKDNHAEENDPINFKNIEESVSKALDSDSGLGEYKDSIIIEQTPEGLNINITDKEGRAMFKDGTADMYPHTKRILAKIANVVKNIPNYIQIVGHTNANFQSESKNYTSWELSTDRANAARRYMVSTSLSHNQIARIVGKGDSDPINKEVINDPRNSRISVTLLRKALMAYSKQPAPEDVILGPEHSGLKKYIQLKRKDPDEEEGGGEGGGH